MVRTRARAGAILQRDEVWLFIAFVLVYAFTSGVLLTEPSLTPLFPYLAESFAHGRTYLITPPPFQHDLMLFEGRQYVPGGPLPALAYVPVKLLRGTPVGLADATVTVVWGALNVVLVYRMLSRLAERVKISRAAKLALCVAFGAGTPHLYLASMGNVWSTAHVCAVTFVCLYASETLGKGRPWLAGLWLGLAGLARPTCWFACPFFL